MRQLVLALLPFLPAEIYAQLLSPTAYPTAFFDVSQSKLAIDALELPLRKRAPLNKRSSRTVKAWALREKARVHGKYHTATSTAGDGLSPLRRRQENGQGSSTDQLPSPSDSPEYENGVVSLTNYLVDLEYTVCGPKNDMNKLTLKAPIYVGSPSTLFDVILDTGSSDLWLAATTCNNATCGAIPRYNSSSSTSALDLNSTFTIRYGQGTASGELFNDTVIMAGRNLTQGFAACSMISNDMLSGNVSGIMGLGFKALAASGLQPYWQNYFSSSGPQSLASSFSFPGFAFSLSRFINITDAADSEPGGLFTLGTLSYSSFVGDINYIDMPNPLQASYWFIPMDAVLFNGTAVPGVNVNTTRVAIDTGTTLIGGPSDVVASIYAQIPGAQQASGDYSGYWTYPCGEEFSIGFTFGNKTYNISDADFNLGIFEPPTAIQSAQCLGVFFDLELSAGSAAIISWVVGAAFLKNVYSVFRLSPNISVGFAELNPLALAPLYPADTGSMSTIPYVHSGGAFGPPAPVTSINGTPVTLAASATFTSDSPDTTTARSFWLAKVSLVLLTTSYLAFL